MPETAMHSQGKPAQKTLTQLTFDVISQKETMLSTCHAYYHVSRFGPQPLKSKRQAVQNENEILIS